jgi:hypothetical protein
MKSEAVKSVNTVEQMKAKLDAFFETATQQDISALLQRTNYDFYKKVQSPEDCFDFDFATTETSEVLTVEIPVTSSSYRRVPNRPIIYIGRGYPAERMALAADHQDLALAA